MDVISVKILQTDPPELFRDQVTLRNGVMEFFQEFFRPLVRPVGILDELKERKVPLRDLFFFFSHGPLPLELGTFSSPFSFLDLELAEALE